MIRIGLGCRSLLAPLTGIGQYTAQLGRVLASRTDLSMVYFYGPYWSDRLEAERAPSTFEKEKAVAGRGRRALCALRAPVKMVVPKPYEFARLLQQRAFTKGVRRRQIALYHEPSFIPFKFDGATVINIHDLALLHYAETQPSQRVRAIGRLLPWAAETADAIITGSEYVRHEILDAFPVAREKVFTVPNGVDAGFRPASIEDTRDVLARHGLKHGNYVLAVGTLEPRKNLSRLLRAYERLPVALRTTHPLVIVGMKGWRYGSLTRELDRLVENGQVRILGYASGQDLPAIYAGSTLVAYPSLYEGFGFPPLEAMASGVPVLTSNRSSIPEVVGDAGMLVEPEDEEAISNALHELLEDEQKRLRLADLGLERAREFTWTRTASQTVEVYRQVLGLN